MFACDAMKYNPLRMLIGCVNKLDDNEKVVLVDEDKYSNLDIFIWRAALSTEHPVEYIHYYRYDYPNTLYPRYDYHLYMDFGYDQFFGERDKKLRKCRFCNGSNSNTSSIFGDPKCSHAISYFLGNNSLFNLEECKKCNNDFGAIEDELANYYHLYRAIEGRKSRSGKPLNPSGFNYEYDSQNKRFSIFANSPIANMPKVGEHFPSDGVTLDFDTEGPVCLHNIYRTLTKYVLSCIPNELLKYFSNTIKWIRGNKHPRKGYLPFVYRIETLETIQSPILGIYIRKDNKKDMPYCIAEFRFLANLYVYAIPFCSNEKDTLTAYLNNQLEKFVSQRYPEDMKFTVEDFCDNEPKLITTHIGFNVTEDTIFQPLTEEDQKRLDEVHKTRILPKQKLRIKKS